MSENRVCPHCGAPVLSEVCQYCGSFIGEVSTQELASEYPTVECRLARFTFFGTLFPLIFAVSFSIPGIMVFLGDGYMLETDVTWPFTLVGIISFFFLFASIYKVVAVRLFGKTLDGVVYGYMDDTVAYNGVPGQKVKILVNASDGKRFILLPLAATTKPYPVNSDIKVRAFKRNATIISKKTETKITW